MSRLLFLEGDSGVGKSTMILQAAAPYQSKGNGFFSQRLVDEKGRTRAFGLAAYRQVTTSIASYEPEKEQNIFFNRGGGNAGIHMEIFEEARELVGKYDNAAFLMLDEIGGIELSSPVFCSFLYELLFSKIPCIGVIKSRQNWERMKLGITSLSQTKALYEKLREDIEGLGGEIMQLNNGKRQLVKERLAQFFKEIADGQKK